mmetsp:Transcript_3359/g.12611  ORF Transcript_3359/g.12611 Transcript_3359/m.12611 type:complete len:99 (-) Transcript_3359:35-331(-)
MMTRTRLACPPSVLLLAFPRCLDDESTTIPLQIRARGVRCFRREQPVFKVRKARAECRSCLELEFAVALAASAASDCLDASHVCLLPRCASIPLPSAS